MINKALHFSIIKHSGQYRKATGLPYVVHPVTAGFIYKRIVHSQIEPSMMAAILLHDTLEDTDTSFDDLIQLFGEDVASLVLEVTNDSHQLNVLGKNDYLKIKLLQLSDRALTIKLIDRLSNVMDNPSIRYVNDTQSLMVYLMDNRMLSKLHLKLVRLILVKCRA